jgi:Flp pilus assembly protein CpaB
MTYRVRNIAVAVMLGLVAALLTSLYVANYKRDVRSGEANVAVFVAAKDIPVGTSGADVARRGLLEKTDVARRAVVPGAISKPEQLDGLVATQAVFAGEQVTTRRFASPSERGIRAQLTGVQRAISVPGDKQQLLVGTLKDGDHVDVVASWTYPEGSQTHYSRLILRDLLVLNAPSATATERLAGSSDEYSVMLRVTDVQVQKLYWAAKNGEWHLELRPPVKAADSPENVESSFSLLREGVRRPELNAAVDEEQFKLRLEGNR